MISLAIGVGIFSLLLWAGTHYERHIRIWQKRHEEKIVLDAEGQRVLLDACDLLMEICGDPQSDEYRLAVKVKLLMERKKTEE